MCGHGVPPGVRGVATGCIALQQGDGIAKAAGVVNDRGVVRFRKVELRVL
jgi:hypothetical protein